MLALQGLQAKQRDFVALGQGAAEFDFGGVVHTLLEGRQDLVPIAAFNRHDEGKRELGFVGVVQLGEARKLVARALVDARTGLLRGAGVSQFALYRGLTG